MDEVSCRACSPIVAAVESTGSTCDALVRDLPFTVTHLRVPANRISWEDFAVFLDRATEMLGGFAAIERVGIDHAEDPATGLMRMLGSRFVSLRLVYTLGAKWYGPTFFTNTTAECEELADGRIRQVVEILPGYRPSRAFFHLMRGVLISTPHVLGLDPAIVDLEVGYRRCVYTIVPPRAPSWIRSLLMRFRDPESDQATLDELRFQYSQLADALARAQRSRQQLEAQSRELETWNMLGRRLTACTDLDELSEMIVDLCNAKGGASGAALWMIPEDADPPQLLRRAGATAGRADDRFELQTAGRSIGYIELWGNSKSLISDLAPWISLALDNARSFKALMMKTHRLETATRERVRAEKRLQRSQKMQAVGRLAGELAHEFSNALMTINGYAEMLADAAEHPGQVRRYLSNILSEVDRAAHLVRRSLSFSRVDANSIQPLDVSFLIDSLEDVLRAMATKSIELTTFATDDPTVVLADQSEIEQIIINLVTNSIDAMPDGGQLTLRAEITGRPAGETEPRLHEDANEFVKIEVSDTGIGIAPEMRSRLFEPFATTKPVGKGTGLGLAVVYGIVERARGTLSVDSGVGKGTTVSVYLPRILEEPERKSVTPSSKPQSTGGEIIMLVEDEDSLRAILRAHLEHAGYRVVSASCGSEALAMCESLRSPIGVLLTDVRMPGIDGISLAHQLRERRQDIGAVLFMTAYAGESVGDLPAGARLVHKPLSTSDLLKQVASALEDSKTTRAGPTKPT